MGDKLAHAFADKRKNGFWSKVRQLNRSSLSSVSIVDGVSGSSNIANFMASKLQDLLNTHSAASRDSLYDLLKSSASFSQIKDIAVSEEDVMHAVHELKAGKCDSEGLSSQHLKSVSSVIAGNLASLVTACLRHGYMPKCFRDSVILMIPKPHKDTSCSQNYRPISLASTLSKVIEHIILLKYENILASNPLQFGFKHGSSTSLCTSLIKQVISRYINRGSKVLGCFLDASKAFDMVDHGILFCKLLKRDLPSPIICFLLHWYIMQKMRVRWDHQFSESFSISNGVRQGSVLSPFLFAVYLDGLLEELSASGVGCHWRWMYAGCFCYADDIALLAPCASALRTMLSICNNYAKSHGLLFNTEKTQLTDILNPTPALTGSSLTILY